MKDYLQININYKTLQAIGIVVLGIGGIVLLWFIVNSCINEWTGETYHKGYVAGFQGANDNIHNLFYNYSTIGITNSSGTEIQIEKYHYCDPCVIRPSYCDLNYGKIVLGTYPV